MKLKRYGFFKELKHGDINGISLKDVIYENAALNEKEQVGYLKSGIILIACTGIVRDVLDAANDIIGSPHILTDGVWAWPADLPYYVEKYHVKIPDDFVKYMESSCWTIPNEGDIKITKLEI